MQCMRVTHLRNYNKRNFMLLFVWPRVCARVTVLFFRSPIHFLLFVHFILTLFDETNLRNRKIKYFFGTHQLYV